MRRFGLRIGSIGVEFASREERQRAVLTFTGGVCCRISDYGLRYADDMGTFSTYERDDKEVLANCAMCKGVFGIDTCPEREYPSFGYDKKWTVARAHLCDACAGVKRKEKELADAKARVAEAEGAPVL